MSARDGRIAASLVLATLGLGLEAGVALGAPGEQRAAGSAVGAASASAAVSAPSIQSRRAQASPGKPGAPIEIGYELASPPAPGVPLDVRIFARGGSGIEDLVLTVHASGAVQAGTPQLAASSADGADRTWTVAATAYGEGTAYLGVLVQGTAGAEHPARNLLVPIRIAAATPAEQTTSPQSAPTYAGQRVIVLPAAGAR